MALGSQDNKTSSKTGGKGRRPEGRNSIHPDITDHMAGEVGEFVEDLTPYLPQELIGGSVPHVPGSETEAVWNAASQACATEKVHFCYTVEGDRVWYLACPSQMLSSNPDSWCPLAAALPGNSEYWDKETVYLYEQEGLASALRWDADTGRMQVFLGASRTILPRIQSMDANFVTINPEIADVIPWRSRMLRSEKLARATARMLLFTGMCVSLIAVLVLVFNYLALNMLDRNLAEAKLKSDTAAKNLMVEARNAMHSDIVKNMACIQQILDGLSQVDGTLVRYEVEKNKAAKWEALVPDAFAAQFGRALRQEQDGRVRVQGNNGICK